MKRSIRNVLERAGGAGRAERAGFTLIEMLIAVGALALVSVGVAAIFEATGRTVQTGRRVSAMASYAALIERRMRDDFSSVTRDGFMIIRNEYADGVGDGNIVIPNQGQTNGYCVPLSDADEHPRLRRIDEIMFFAKGQFVSLRDLLDGRFVAKSDAAAVYYGHGQKGRAVAYNPPASDPYYAPAVNAMNTDRFARLGYQGPTPAPTVNPNRYASDWILVRQVTLLRPPQTSAMTLPVPRPFNMTPQQMADSDIQVGLQPAASNLFRALAAIFPTAAPAGLVRGAFDSGNPFRSSGLVDIATTDLAEIKAVVCTADRGPGNAPGFYSAADVDFFNPLSNAGPDGSNKGVDGKSRLDAGSVPNGDPNILAREQAWMDDALPAISMAQNPDNRTRVRCESAPNNYVGVLSTTYASPEEAPSRRADQVMLSASNFLPHCTEFIVEWSAGVQYSSDPAAGSSYVPGKAGQLVWYGMPRRVNGDLVADTYQRPIVAGPGSVWAATFGVPFTHVDGTPDSHAATARVIHGQGFRSTQPQSDPVTSYFGYTDPTFNPDRDAPTGSTAPDGKLDSPGDSRTPTIPWPWPKFVRITMSLADPNNPSVEQSFQFVFDIPGVQ